MTCNESGNKEFSLLLLMSWKKALGAKGFKTIEDARKFQVN